MRSCEGRYDFVGVYVEYITGVVVAIVQVNPWGHPDTDFGTHEKPVGQPRTDVVVVAMIGRRAGAKTDV